MKAPPLPGRTHYAASGGVDWTRFGPLGLLAIGASALGAGLLYLLLVWGFYFLILVPFLAAVGIAVLVRTAVAKGHCRSRLLGALSGLGCGLILYLGYYYVGMVDTVGFAGARQIGWLPRYIHFRLNTDVSRDPGSPSHKEESERPSSVRFYLNLFVFGVEFLGVLVLTTGSGWRRSREPYCEGCKRWLKRELTLFEPDRGPLLTAALQDRSAHSLATLCATPVYAGLPNTTLAVEYLKWLLKRELSRRASPLVNPAAPDAAFVEVVPRSNWGKVQLDSAADVGFLRIDAERREILFEGDKERYRIPAAALISCEVESFVEGQGAHGGTKLFYVMLRARQATAVWEAPLRERGDLGLFRTGRRKRRAAALHQAIRELMIDPRAPLLSGDGPGS